MRARQRLLPYDATHAMTFDLISFDLDGTLVDTASKIAEAANRALHAHGIAKRSADEITGLIGAGTRELMLRLLARCVAEPYTGCHEALALLKAFGVRLACTTNKELRHALRVLEAARLEGYFDLIIGGDSLPEKKPHASVLEHAMRRLNASAARTAHVGDTAIDVASVRSAGVAAWAVPYGYSGGRPIASANPDCIFAFLLEVAQFAVAGRLRRSRR